MTNGKRKGSGYERALSKILTKWASGQDKDYWFYRTAASGGIPTMSGGNPDLSGDIMPLNEDVSWMKIFSFEAKCGYGGASFDKHLTGVKGNCIRDFWKQCTEDATKHSKIPILVFKKDRTKAWIGTSFALHHKLEKYLSAEPMIHLRYENLPDLYTYDLDTFLKIITPEILKEETCNILD